MFSQGVDEARANFCGEWFAVTHRIAGVGIDQGEGCLLVSCLLQVGFKDADVLHGRECCGEVEWFANSVAALIRHRS